MAFGFFDGQKADASPESIKRKREMVAQLLRGNSRAPQNVGEGFNAIGNNIAAAITRYRANQAEQAGNASSAEAMRNIYSGFGGAPVAAVGGPPVASGPSTPAVTPAAGTGILSFANQGATRNQPIVNELQGNIQTAVSTVYGPGYRAQVYSGGQPGIGSGGKRVGSTRHDHGNAADLYVIGPNGQRVTGDKLALLGRHWLQNSKGGVGMEMKGGGIHLDVHKNRAPIWTYGAVSPAQAALVKEFGGRPPRITQTASAGPQSNEGQMQDGAGELQAGGSETMGLSGAGVNPASLFDMAPPADAMGQGIADNEEQTRAMEAQMAAEQGLPYAGNEPGTINQSDVYSPIPMGFGRNPFVPYEPDAMAQAAPAPAPAMDRATFEQVTAGLPQRAPAFTGPNAGLAPSWAGDAEALAPGAQEASGPNNGPFPTPPPRPADLRPQSPLVPQAMRQPMPMPMPMDMGGENSGGGAMQFIESEFARREGRPDPRMAMGAPMGYNPFVPQALQAPQMAGDGGSVQGASQGGAMAGGPAQAPAQARQAGMISPQDVQAVMSNPFTSEADKRFVMDMWNQQRARAQAEVERARVDAQNRQTARDLGIPESLGGVAPVVSARAAQMFGNRSENIAATNAGREAEGRRMGLQGPALQQYTLTGQLPNAANNENKIAAETRAREADAARIGLKPGDPRYQTFVLTGKMPREDAQPLTATDKKAILEADELVNAGQGVIRSLEDAKKLSPQVNTGYFASGRASIGNALPDALVPDFLSSKESSEATAVYENLVTGQALGQLKTMFGAAPTEGERKILLELQASVNKPDSVRQEILGRAIAEARKSLEFNRQRAASLRGNEYYKPEAQRGQGQGQPNQPNQPNTGKVLRYNPKTGALE